MENRLQQLVDFLKQRHTYEKHYGSDKIKEEFRQHRGYYLFGFSGDETEIPDTLVTDEEIIEWLLTLDFIEICHLSKEELFRKLFVCDDVLIDILFHNNDFHQYSFKTITVYYRKVSILFDAQRLTKLDNKKEWDFPLSENLFNHLIKL